ncbi:MAG: alpha/beta fold hydrolase [Sandaracinus sp.]|nr:alpha/beta fold hydrolase [Sandaracinus sp.]
MDPNLAFAGIPSTRTFPPAVPEGSPEGATIALHARDGYELGGTLFSPTGAPRMRLLINGGTGVPSRFYRHYAKWLAEHGVTTLTYDYRGIGLSRRGSVRNTPHTYTDWATNDFPGALAALEAAAPDVPTVILGHSFGGQALGLSDATKRADAVVFLGAQSGYWKNWSGPARWRLGMLWHVTAPLVTATLGYVPAKIGVGQDLPPRVMNDWARWCRTPGYYTEHVEGAEARLASFTMPRLVLGFDDDNYAPKAAIDQLAGWLDGDALDRIQLAPEDLARTRLGHFGFFRPDVTRGWAWLQGWIEEAVRR